MTIRKPISLPVKLGATMTSVIVIALLMATTLNLLRFEETYRRLIAQRLEVPAQEIARVVVTGLDLGLGIRTQANLPAVIHDYMANHPDITAISIFDCTGQVAVSEGGDGSHPWSDHLGALNWHVFGEDRVSVGTMVENNLGKCAAGIAVETSAESYVAAMRTVTNRFILVGLLVTVAACLTAFGAALLFDRRHSLRRLDDDLSRLATTDGGDPAATVSADDFSDPWERMLAQSYLDARPNLASRVKSGQGDDAT